MTLEPLAGGAMRDLSDNAAAVGDGGSCSSQRPADDSRNATTRRCDAPGGVDLVPVVAAVEHPWSDDAHVGSDCRVGDITPGADTEIRHVPNHHRLTWCA